LNLLAVYNPIPLFPTLPSCVMRHYRRPCNHKPRLEERVTRTPGVYIYVSLLSGVCP
jgi:hypothetical protein